MFPDIGVYSLLDHVFPGFGSNFIVYFIVFGFGVGTTKVLEESSELITHV